MHLRRIKEVHAQSEKEANYRPMDHDGSSVKWKKTPKRDTGNHGDYLLENWNIGRNEMRIIKSCRTAKVLIGMAWRKSSASGCEEQAA